MIKRIHSSIIMMTFILPKGSLSRCIFCRRVARGAVGAVAPPKKNNAGPQKKEREREEKKKEDVGRKREKESRTVQRIVFLL